MGRRNPMERKGVMQIYTTEEFSGAGYPHVVRMSFELPYLDWCRFERSELFRHLTKYLEELQTQDIQSGERIDQHKEKNANGARR